jgi:hypothetical protein
MKNKDEFNYATTEQLSVWKELYGVNNVHGFAFKAVDKWPAMVGYFRTPSITDISMVQAKVDVDPGGSFDALCRAAHLGGDAILLENEMAKAKIATVLMKAASTVGEMEILNV